MRSGTSGSAEGSGGSGTSRPRGGNLFSYPSTIVCFRCGTVGHIRRDCPRKWEQRDTAWTDAQVPPPPEPLTIRIRVNQEWGEALLDSGCTQTLVRTGWVRVPKTGGKVNIRCVHGDRKQYPLGDAVLEVRGEKRRMVVGLAQKLPYPVILGRDWPGLAGLMDQGAPPKDCMEGEGGLGAEQREDPTLKVAWEEAKKGGKVPGVLGMVIRDGLLYREGKDPRTGEEVSQLVLPRSKREQALSLAHECPLAGHMREAATTHRLLARVYWPGIYRDIKEFCETCPACQYTQPKGKPGGELQPMPIIDTPFERIAIDLVGPLPKGKGGYQYILVLIDYATRYPEAVPLRSTRASVLAAELIKIFTRVGFPKEVLTDQGTNLMGTVMQEMWQQLGVHHLHTSVYHPQCNGLVERFNKTLKGMLRRFAVQQPLEWPRYVEPLLFAVREVPQASTGYSPFELLFGRKPRGILDLTREQWEGKPREGAEGQRTDLGSLRERLQQLAKWVRRNLEVAQRGQKTSYDRKVQPREFLPGQDVLVLLPTSDVKLLAQWRGPYKVVRRVSEVDYEVDLPDHRVGRKVYHVNLLKAWRTREVGVSLTEELGPSQEEVRSPAGKVQVGEGLAPERRREIEKIQAEFPEVFSKVPGCTHLVQHDIVLKTKEAVRLAPRKWPKHWEKALVEEVQTMLQLGVIEPSTSEWRSYPVMVPKADGTVRVCIDFRRVNEVSQFDAYPMPRVPGLLEKLGTARYLTTLDLTKGYWQIPLAERARECTAFATPVGLFQFVRMPFGLHGAAATFQRLVDKLLASHAHCAAAYIDDIIIYSETWEQHLRDVREVVRTIGEAGLTINPEKCKMGVESAQFLGFEVGKGEVRPVISKVGAIQAVPAPKNKREVQRFLGMVGYYRSFIPNFSQVAAPLTDATKKRRKGEWVWTPECQGAFEALKRALCEAPVLRSPDFHRPFKVLTDASARGVGAVLAQDFAGEEHPILYLSRKLSPAEQKYSTIEREALAVKWALDTLKYYLLGAPFELVTDHAPLTWLNRMKDSNARLTRWYLSLQPYKFSITYKRGPAHLNADFLSRQGDDGPSASEGAAAPILPGGSVVRSTPAGRGVLLGWTGPKGTRKD